MEELKKMGNNTLSNSLRNALSYENEYNKALEELAKEHGSEIEY